MVVMALTANLVSAWASGPSVTDHPSGTLYMWESPSARGPQSAAQKSGMGRPQVGGGTEALLHKTMDNVFDATELKPHFEGMGPSSDPNEFRKALSTMDQKLLGEKSIDRAPVDQEIRYRMPEAEEVFLMWGVDGWKSLPAAERPKGTSVAENGVMSTPMRKQGDVFTVTLRVPGGTNIDYGFWIEKKRDGAKAGLWDGNQPFAGYQVFVRPQHPVEVIASQAVTKVEGATSAPPPSLVTQEIVYPLPGAREVVLVWGINGWGFMPESARPLGTIVKDGKMLTPLRNQAGTFRTTVQVPPGTTIDYGFIVTRTSDGRSADLWDNNRQQFFHVKVVGNGSVNVKPTLKLRG